MNERWFNQNWNKPYKEEVTDGVEDLFIWRNILIQVRCKSGLSETVKCYQVLAFFTKYYNRWFVSIEDEFSWVNNAKNNVKVLIRLMIRTSGAFLDVRLEKDGYWEPQHFFVL